MSAGLPGKQEFQPVIGNHISEQKTEYSRRGLEAEDEELAGLTACVFLKNIL